MATASNIEVGDTVEYAHKAFQSTLGTQMVVTDVRNGTRGGRNVVEGTVTVAVEGASVHTVGKTFAGYVEEFKIVSKKPVVAKDLKSGDVMEFSDIKRGDKIQTQFTYNGVETILIGVAQRRSDGQWFTEDRGIIANKHQKLETYTLLDRIPQPSAADYAVGTVLKSGGRYVITKVAENVWSSFSLSSGNVVQRTDDEIDAFEEIDVISEGTGVFPA